VSDKTEDPTPKRLRKAREEGDSGASAYAAQSVAFVVAVALAPAAVSALAAHAARDLREALAFAGSQSPVAEVATRFDATALATAFVALALPVLLAAGIAGAVVHVVQTGGAVATKRLALKLDRLNPAQGIKGLFSGTRAFAVVRSLAAAGIVCWLALSVLRERVVDIAALAHGRLAWAGVVVSETAGSLAWRAGLVGLALGVIDILVTRRAWLRRLRMSKDEVRREYKESEGDPQLKAARERAYQQLLAQAAVANVRTASVVVVNPTHVACALRYDEREGDEAPTVVANGEGDLAARIVRAARDYAVPVVRDVPLARALLELRVGDAIPEALYEAVAEILRTIGEA
jgi:flagellar biosynthesis protein FlhB